MFRLIGTGALWSRSGRKPFGAFRQPKLSVFGPYTDRNVCITAATCVQVCMCGSFTFRSSIASVDFVDGKQTLRQGLAEVC